MGEGQKADDPLGFGRRVSDAMSIAGMGPAEVAAAVGVDPRTVSNWQRGVLPRGQRLQRLAAELGVSASWLLNGHEGIAMEVAQLRRELREEFEAIKKQLSELLAAMQQLLP